RQMLWRRHHAQTQTPRETEGRQEADESLRVSEHPAGSFYPSPKSLSNFAMPKTNNRVSEKQPAKTAAARANNPAPPISTAQPQPSTFSWLLPWLLSRTVRHATAMRKHVHKLLNHQRDILAQPAIQAIETGISDLRDAVTRRENDQALTKQMESLEQTANKWLKPYPNAAWRENIEVLLVALTVAMGIRTFFLQPFKIPTGSMQPTF